jgi:hypothetical protein
MFFRDLLMPALVPTYAAVFSMYVTTCILVANTKSRTLSSLPELKYNVLITTCYNYRPHLHFYTNLAISVSNRSG